MKYQYCSYILFIEFYKTSAMQLARILSRLQPRSKCVSSYLHCASISLILISTFSVNHLQRQQVKSKGNPRTEPNADIKRERSNLVKILQRRWIRCLQQLRKLHYFQWILSLWIITMLYSKKYLYWYKYRNVGSEFVCLNNISYFPWRHRCYTFIPNFFCSALP